MDSNTIITDIRCLNKDNTSDYSRIEWFITNASRSLQIDSYYVCELINKFYLTGNMTKLDLDNGLYKITDSFLDNFIEMSKIFLESHKYYEFNTVLDDYIKTRKVNSDCICFSPYISMVFRRGGNIATCCWGNYNIGNYPKDTIKNIWQGHRINNLKKNVKKEQFNTFNDYCTHCINNLFIKNFDLVGMKSYDDYFYKLNLSSSEHNPKIFNFEMSNTCNCECITCGGNWSSKILENREGLPKHTNPYDQNFREQLKEFYPTLSIANFLGGEPFLNPLNYDIIEDIQKINPNIKICITTNGTVLNKRIEDILKHKNIDLVVSMDGFTKETYEFIRRGAKFDTFMSNVKYFIESKRLSITITPIIQNWKEVPMIIQFCQDNNLNYNFNLTDSPLGGRIKGIHINGEYNIGNIKHENLLPEICLNRLSKYNIKEILDYYMTFTYNSIVQQKFDSFIGVLKSYYNK